MCISSGQKTVRGAFRELRRRLVTAPILMVPSGDSGFVISSDASSSGLVCVLMQNGKVIAYAPRKLKNHERNTYS